MEKHIKIIQVSNVLIALTAGYCLRVLFEFFAVLFGPVAKAYSLDGFRHGLPVAFGILVFAVLQFHPRIRKWMQAVVSEIDKVVWPTKKDTFSMTAVVCVILLVSGVVLGLFDLSAGTLMRFIMN